MDINSLIKRISQLIRQGQEVISTRYSNGYDSIEWIKNSIMDGFRAAGLSFIERVYGALFVKVVVANFKNKLYSHRAIIPSNK